MNLNNNEFFFRLFAELSHSWEMWIDPDGQYRYVSPSCFRITGYHPDEFQHDPGLMERLIHPDDQPHFVRSLKGACPNKEVIDIVLRITSRKGKACWISLMGKPVFDDDGTWLGWRISNHDITEYHWLEHSLSQSNAMLRGIIDHLPSAVFVKNIQGRFLLFNQEAALHLHIISNQSGGKPDVKNILSQENLSLLPEEKQVMASGKPIVFEEHILHQGTYVTYLSTIFPIYDEQQTVWAIGCILTDITERKNMENAIRRAYDELEQRIQERTKTLFQVNVALQAEIRERIQAEQHLQKERLLLWNHVEERTAELRKANAELSHAVRTKDVFLANMSHELRTPLNAILGLTEAMIDNVYGVVSKEQSDILSTIESSARHLLALINDILDLSKVESGKMDLVMETVSVEMVCQSGLQFIKQQALKKHIQVSFHLDDSIRTIVQGTPHDSLSHEHEKPITIQADQRRLKQILINLLSNAVKFTPEGGKVGLDVCADTDQQRMAFTVWDTGIGIAEDDLKQLFQPFVQVDRSLSRRFEGTGLGLALVARLTELHGGSINVESQLGKGSRFTVYLPWIPGLDDLFSDNPPQNTMTLPQIPLTQGQGQRILLTEDNELLITMFTTFLQSKGYHIIVARNGVQAVELARTEHPDLILMDIQMPVMDGMEAIRHIRFDKNLVDTPIIAVTALAMSGDREQCLAVGANEYLSKPVSLKELLQKIETFLSPKAHALQEPPSN